MADSESSSLDKDELLMLDKFKSLDSISEKYDSTVDFDRYFIEFNFAVMRQYLNGPEVLEMGCASGVMTKLLLTQFPRIDALDGSQKYIDELKPIFGDKVKFALGLFEEYQTNKRYNDIILARALEHMEDPVALLKKVGSWLDRSRPSAIHIVVPNANSLHRQVGVAMGVLPSVTSLSERDHKFGHKRVYTPALLQEHVQGAGLKIEIVQGVFLKPLSNAQMESWPRELVDAFFKVGEHYSDICAEIYLKCGLA